MAAVFKVSFGVNFNVLPGKLLAQPMKTRLARHLHKLGALGGIDLLLQKDVDAKGIDVDIIYARVGLLSRALGAVGQRGGRSTL